MLDHFIERKAARVRLGNKMIGELAQASIAVAPAEGSLGGPLMNKCSNASTRDQHPRPFQLGIDLGHRIGIDSQIDGELAHGGQLVPDAQLARGNRELNRPFKLVIKRRWVFGVEMEHLH